MATKNSSFKMSQQSKRLAGQIRNAHERGAFLRQMANAEQSYERHRQRQPRAKDKDE